MKLFKAERYKDERGEIINATPMNPFLRNVMYITGREDAVRGNHTHKKDTHYCMVVWGQLRYEWVDPKEPGEIKHTTLNAGDIVLSEVGEKHRFIFETDGAFIAMATEPRTHENYEEDVIREDF